MFTKLQFDLNELGNWLASNKLQFSIEKTKYIFFRPKAYVLTKDLTLSLYNETTDEVNIFKFLGLWLYPHLEWYNHVTWLELKINQNKYALKNIAMVVGIRNLRELYYAHINSYVNYGILLWSPMLMETHLIRLKWNLDQLVKNLFIDEHAYAEYSILKCKDLIWLELCKFVYKYINDLLPVSVKIYLCVVMRYIIIIWEIEMHHLSTSIIVLFQIRVM